MTSRNRLSSWLIVCAIAAHFGSGCSPANPSKESSGSSASAPKVTKIVTTTGMVTDIVRHVAGSRATVTALIESGVDPHLFKPTRSHIKQLQDADVVFFSGLTLEGRMVETFTQLQRSGKPVYAVTESLDKEYLRSPPDFAGHYDPHVWMDVTAWSQCVDHVAKSLAKFDPPHAEEYIANAKAYREELTKLDDYVRESIKSIPERQRVLVTAHDAFEYFSRAYKIDVKSVQGVTTESEAGVLDVNRLVDFLVERKLPAIFIESSVNAKNIQAVMEGTKSRDVVIGIGGELYSDAMGVEGTYEGTYIGMIDHNATVIAASLGGSVPEKGMNGKLATEIKGGEPK
ncbi:MAG: troA [Schlesneria sp.]|nr:troA [Schlesneria sp.]